MRVSSFTQTREMKLTDLFLRESWKQQPKLTVTSCHSSSIQAKPNNSNATLFLRILKEDANDAVLSIL
jgi:hypothetical protein